MSVGKTGFFARASLAVLAAAGTALGRNPAEDPDDYAVARQKMVREQLVAREIRDARVLEAMGSVPRHEFVPPNRRDRAYQDRPLPIGHEQTISQPYIVAVMSEIAELQPGEKVLEVGTGSGYQAAVLSALGVEVYSIEIVKPLAEQARATLERLGFDKVTVRHGDGYRGWPEHAPFDAILVTAAPAEVPEPLVEQLAVGGRLVIPVGRGVQDLMVISKDADGTRRERLFGVRFVPMTGEAEH
jgi:protein-L-isoaspartate(D-aspartate) O-methyltransferase